MIQARGRHLAPAQLTSHQHAATKLHAGICRAHVLSAAWCRWPTLATPQVRPQPTGAQLCWHTPEASMLLPESACQTVPLPSEPHSYYRCLWLKEGARWSAHQSGSMAAWTRGVNSYAESLAAQHSKVAAKSGAEPRPATRVQS